MRLLLFTVCTWQANGFHTYILTNDHRYVRAVEELFVSTERVRGDETTASSPASFDAVSGDGASEENQSLLDLVSFQASRCLMESEKLRNAEGKGQFGSGSSATNWIDEASAYQLRSLLNQLTISPTTTTSDLSTTIGTVTSPWRWLRASPHPIAVDWTRQLQTLASEVMDDEALVKRLACRLVVLPSGLSVEFLEPTATVVMGKLLLGGVTRSRRLSNNREAAVRTEMLLPDESSRSLPNVPPWVMFGGLPRQYSAVDMGSAVVLDIVLLPYGQKWEDGHLASIMSLKGSVWSFDEFLKVRPTTDLQDADDNDDTATNDVLALNGQKRNDAFQGEFRTRVGGLRPQIDAIVRRVLDGRIISPTDNAIKDGVNAELNVAANEAKELALLGLTPVRGLLLYGPPGCGKTAMAREIAKALRARSPKIVSAPELLDRWVGGSEKLVRSLFVDAEAELRTCDGDASKSALHVIVIDEIDAVFRKRSSSDESGEATRSSVVNQILAKLDGVQAIPNVLLVGMTNRLELLDDALLRPGRLEVKIEVPLPNKEGRREILDIHFGPLRKMERLSAPLCAAIDGTPVRVSSEPQSNGLLRVLEPFRRRRVYDLAADSVTGKFSGADIAGLVRCAGSLALARLRKTESGLDELVVTLEDVKEALKEVKGLT